MHHFLMAKQCGRVAGCQLHLPLLPDCQQPEEYSFQVKDYLVSYFHTILNVFHCLDAAKDACVESNGEGCLELFSHSLSYID